MTTGAPRQRILHALSALALLAAFLWIGAASVYASAEAVFAKETALKARANNARALEERLIAARRYALTKLSPFGETLADLETLADANEAAKAIAANCRSFEKPAGSAAGESDCVVQQVQLSASMAMLKTRVSAPLSAATLAQKLSAVAPPARLSSIVIDGAAGGPPQTAISFEAPARQAAAKEAEE